MKFPCTKCGACCKMAAKMKLVPTNDKGDCMFLTEKNECSIYDKRPEICNVSRMFKKHKKDGVIPKKLPKKDYYKINAELCNKFMDELNIPKNKRIEPF